MTHHPDQEISFLLETLKLAGSAIMPFFRRGVASRSKSDESLVTDADLASERLITSRIREHFPDDIIFAEESGVQPVARVPGQRVWVVDPLDGTTNFAHGYPFFCVSIARGVFDSQGQITVELGGIIDPITEKVWWAAKGHGAFVRSRGDQAPRRLSALEPTPLREAFLVTGFYYFRDEALARELGAFQRISSSAHAVRRDGSAALDLALVAERIFDGFWERGLKLWDVAAGALLVEECGGIVRNYATLNTPFDIEGDGLIAAHPDMVRSLDELIRGE
jgi:myo-inositol-1(or 4)-monophosphatase